VAVLALAGIGAWTVRKWASGGIQWRGWKISLLNSSEGAGIAR
jgi:hypothetical protein